MLQQIHGKQMEVKCEVTIKTANFPKPFPSGVEYNAPVHGPWNIVHIGMLVPESIQIYACAMNCGRGVVMTAAEMGEMDRISTITIQEKDIVYGDLEKQLIDGVTDLLHRRKKQPKLIFMYPVCIHHFLGTDMAYVYRVLEERFPEICFAKCFMDPTMQKHAMPPDVRLRRELYAGLKNMEKNENAVCIVGNDFSYDETSELKEMLLHGNKICHELANCKTYEQYEKQAESSLNIVTHPGALVAAKELEKRLGTKYLYLPLCYGAEEIERNLQMLSKELGIVMPDLSEKKRECEEKLQEAAKLFENRLIAVDYTFTPRPLSLARLLLEHGFCVERVYLDQINKEEEKDFYDLKKQYPKLLLISTNQFQMRYYDRKDCHYFALGQKAAYFTGTEYFVNEIIGGGHYGFDGICKLVENMMESLKEKKDTKSIVPRKGLGCSCVLASDVEECNVGDSIPKLVEDGKEGRKDTKVLMPVYSGDVSGVSSALYEMGGMVIMHDASGCNSTYNTHDELRWYEKESQIYISGVSEIDAVMGDDKKFIQDVSVAADDLKPRFIALASSPVPYVNGMDFKATAELITKRTGLPCFFVNSNGTYDYITGVGNAFYEYVKHIVPTKQEILQDHLTENTEIISEENGQKKKIKVNVFGITPLDFAECGYETYLQNLLEEHDMELYSCFSMGSQVANCDKASLADVSLVVSSTGLKAAKYLWQREQIPYVVGMPLKNTAEEMICLLKEAIVKNVNKVMYRDTDAEYMQIEDSYQKNKEMGNEKTAVDNYDFCLIGEPVTSESIVFSLEKQSGKRGKAFYSVDVPKDLLFDKEALVTQETVFMEKIKRASAIIADPLLKPLCPENVPFYNLPHVACSGRIAVNYLNELWEKIEKDFNGK